MTDPFFIVPHRGKRSPLVLSVPHCGVEFPPEVAAQLLPRYVENPEDTDWFVHQLYDFAPELGVTVIHARYSRYVIDLNRDPDRKPLYSDGRKETALVPVSSFAGEPLYPGTAPDTAEIERRRRAYYDPYHRKLAALLEETRSEFGRAAVYEAHSIKRFVPSIRPHPFPDLMLGDGNGATAHPRLRQAALDALRRNGAYTVALNDPFQGGYITRHFGAPSTGIHALQLEMSQDVYLDDRGAMDAAKSTGLKATLRDVIASVIETLKGLP